MDQSSGTFNETVWEEGNRIILPVLEGDIACDVCVIGLGGSGLTAIIELLGLGQKVAGIDAGVVGGGAAGRNGGLLLAGWSSFYHQSVEKYGRKRALGLYLRTLEQRDMMIDEAPDAIRLTGSLRIASNDEEMADCRNQFEAMRADDLPVAEYIGPEGEGLMIPTDGVYNPFLRCRILAKRATDAGAMLFEKSAALNISGSRVETANGVINCRKVIVAVDGGLENVLPELSGRVRTARLQMIATAPTDEVKFTRPVYYRWGFEYWQQLPDRRIALGGMRDFGGDEEWTHQSIPSDAIQKSLEIFLRTKMGVQAEITHRWAAVAAFNGSGVPIIEEVRPGVWAIGSYSGTGNIIGAICGRGVAQMVVKGETSLLDELRPLP